MRRAAWQSQMESEPIGARRYAGNLYPVKTCGPELRPLPKRWRKLERLVAKAVLAPLRFSEAFDDPAKLLGACTKHRLEGIVSKRTDRPYVSGATTSWIKVKCQAWREANRERFKLFEKP